MITNSLALKILAVFAPIVLLAEAVVFGFQAWGFYSEKREALITDLDDIAAIQQAALAPAVWEFDVEEIQNVLNQAGKIPTVAGMVVFDDKGAQLASFGEISPAIKKTELFKTVDVIFVEQEENLIVGKLSVAVTGSLIEQELWNFAKLNAMVLIRLFLALIGAAHISTRFLIGRPLARMKEAIETEHTGTARVLVEWESNDEIGTVVRAYNDMQRYQDEADRKLEKYQTHLEELVKERTQQITSSIQYASYIQRSILPKVDVLEDFFIDHFVIWQPKDVVGGDLYWARQWGDGFLLALGDCTGHGVPGAFMTMLATGALDRAQAEVEVGDVAAVISRMHQIIQTTQQGRSSKSGTSDGLELGVCYVEKSKARVTFCGARFSLFVLRGNAIEEVKGDKSGIGYSNAPQDLAFAKKVVDIQPDDQLYLTTDGYVDQIGGERRRGFGKKRLKTKILEIAAQNMATQRQALLETLEHYQGDEERLDDISVIGFKSIVR